jgi:sulfatase maturation enzyme AslB (radical SAM superfamily)
MNNSGGSLKNLADLIKHYEAGDIESARGLCLEILTTTPNQSQVLTLLGIIEGRQNNVAKAEESFRRAIEVDPEDKVALHHLESIRHSREVAQDTPYSRMYLAQKPLYMDFPRRISIETVGRCNASCNFCPHSELERRFTGMTDELFDKIISDLSAIPKEIPISIIPNLVNEPFMDRQILDRLEKINRALPQARIYIFTNFNVLPHDFFERVRNIVNLDGFNISFNAANKTEYAESMGIDFDRTVANIRKLLTMNSKRQILNNPLVISRVADLTERDLAYKEQCREIFSDFEEHTDFNVHIKNRTDWLGSIQSNQSEIPLSQPCGAWLDINVFCNGTVPHCCMDSKGEYAIGDANHENLLDIYNAPGFRKYRESLLSREMAEPCRRCALMQ